MGEHVECEIVSIVFGISTGNKQDGLHPIAIITTPIVPELVTASDDERSVLENTVWATTRLEHKAQ